LEDSGDSRFVLSASQETRGFPKSSLADRIFLDHVAVQQGKPAASHRLKCCELKRLGHGGQTKSKESREWNGSDRTISAKIVTF